MADDGVTMLAVGTLGAFDRFSCYFDLVFAERPLGDLVARSHECTPRPAGAGRGVPSSPGGDDVRPPVDDSLIALLRSRLPEFDNHFLDLRDIYDEDLTPEIVLMELADFVANLIVGGRGEGTLERCFEALEGLAASGQDGPELLAYSFLGELPLTTRDAAAAYFGPAVVNLARCLADGSVEEYLASLRRAGEGDPGPAAGAGEGTGTGGAPGAGGAGPVGPRPSVSP